MAGRREAKTVQYFPHYTTDNKVLGILESYFSNDGYVFYYKLLELLGSTPGHYYSCKKTIDWDFLVKETGGLKEAKIKQILQKLADLNFINKLLWNEHKIIYSQSFIDDITDAYKRRKAHLTTLPELAAITGIDVDSTEYKKLFDGIDVNINAIDANINSISANINDTKERDSKEKEIEIVEGEVKETKPDDDLPLLKLRAESLFKTKWDGEYDNTQLNTIIEAIKKCGMDRVSKAFEIASKRGHPNVGYVLGILNTPDKVKTSAREQRKIGS